MLVVLTIGPDAPPGSHLTRREWQVATLLAEGLSNRAIAARLSVAQRTAESHVERILTKLGVRTRVQVATWVTGALLRDVGERAA